MDEMKNASVPESTADAVPARTFTPSETAFAWGCFLFGYLFFRTLPVHTARLGGLLFVLVLFIGTTAFLRIRGIRPPVFAIVPATAACTLSVSLILCANRQVCALAYTFSLLTYLYFLGASCGRTVSHSLTGALAADYLNASLLLPFCALGSIFRAAFSGKAARAGGKIFGKILSGAILALIPTAAVAVLLSYDAQFSDLMHKIFSADISIVSVLSHMNSILFGIFAGMYLFGLYAAATDKEDTPIVTKEGLQTAARALRRLPALTVVSATLPILFLYAVFFLSQRQYYLSAFTGVLPENLSYAQYAREGFFNLCAVSAVNLCVLIAARLLAHRKGEAVPVFLKIITVLYSSATLVLIATALSKMALYIGTYGLTQKRVYASAFMIALAVVFLLILLRQFLPKVPTAIGIVSIFLLFSVLALGNTDAQIARYNVERYLNGTLSEADVDALAALGDTAIPQLVRLAEFESKQLGTDVKTMLERHHTTAMRNRLCVVLKTEAARFATREERGVLAEFFAFNIPVYKAERALQSAGLLP